MPANRLPVMLLLLALSGSSFADQLAFGSFRSAVNANNWAQKLSSLLAQEITVSPVARTGGTLYRVMSPHLQEADLQALIRRADAAGIPQWRVRGTPPERPVAPAEAIGQVSPTRPLPRMQAPNPRSETVVPADTEPVAPVPVANAQHEWEFGLQSRLFAERGVFGQDRYEGSISVEYEYFRGWRDDTRSITFSPFFRYDSADADRTHGDIRDLYYSRVDDSWDLHLGIKRVFWGVTEFHHLVDIVNQTDLVENIDTEDKLGQPMAQLTMVRDWGILDLHLLAGFRERTFAGSDGRLRLPIKVLDSARYESGAEDKRVDAAVRWSHNLGPLEFGLHHFSGTSRDPILIPEQRGTGPLALRPYYPVIDQSGIDAQAIYGDWAFKLEGISRSGFGPRYAAANVGFERTLVGVLGSRADLGLVVEYMWDERDDEAFNTLFEHDLALGGRWQLNDFADTQALLGVIFDTESDDYFVSLEASRRLSPSWMMSLEGRIFGGGESLRQNTAVPLLLSEEYKTSWLQQDDYLQLEIKKFF